MKIEQKDKKQIVIALLIIVISILGINLCGRLLMNSQIYSHNDEVRRDVIDIDDEQYKGVEDYTVTMIEEE